MLYWHDPMVPGQKFDKPGKSPFMDMQLVPVYADGGGDEGKVTISPRVQQNLGVRVAEVTTGVLAPALEAVGSVAYNERDVAVVQARANGYVERLLVRAPLDPVRKGQPLAELYVPDWVAAQEEYLSVRRMAGTGLDTLVDAARQRMRLAGMSEEQIRLVESTGKVHPRLTVTAPTGGVVAELSAREGMTVMSGAPLFRINGLGTVWVNAEVPESQAAPGAPGQRRRSPYAGAARDCFQGASQRHPSRGQCGDAHAQSPRRDRQPGQSAGAGDVRDSQFHTRRAQGSAAGAYRSGDSDRQTQRRDAR